MELILFLFFLLEKMKRLREEERYRVIESLTEIRDLIPKISRDVCQGVLGDWYLDKQVGSSSLLIEEDTREIKAALFFSEEWGKFYITMCAISGHGRTMFNEFVNRFQPDVIVIDSIPSAVGFWRKLGFRVRKDCDTEENETVGKVLDDFTSEPFDSIDPDEDEWLHDFLHIVDPAFDDEQLEEFIYDEEQRIAYHWLKDYRSQEGLNMRWCKAS